MTEIIEHYGARIEIYEKYGNGDVDAKIFTAQKDGSFTAGIFSKENYQRKLDEIKNEALKNNLEAKTGGTR